MDVEHKSDHLLSKCCPSRCHTSALILTAQVVPVEQQQTGWQSKVPSLCSVIQTIIIQTKHLVWLPCAKRAFKLLFFFHSKNKHHVRNKEMKVKREAQLSFSPSHLKARICTVSIAFLSPGECLPGANYNCLNRAVFSLFHSKSHRNHGPQMQLYLHLDICSQRDFSSSLIRPRKYRRHSNHPPRVSL